MWYSSTFKCLLYITKILGVFFSLCPFYIGNFEWCFMPGLGKGHQNLVSKTDGSLPIESPTAFLHAVILSPNLLITVSLLFICVLFKFLFTPLVYYIPTAVPLLFPLPSLFPQPPTNLPSSRDPPLRKVLPGTSSKHNIVCHYKTRHILSRQGSTRQPSRRKRYHMQGREEATGPCSHS